jgi:type IV pilus biogenesis protein CpaD/CtpE
MKRVFVVLAMGAVLTGCAAQQPLTVRGNIYVYTESKEPLTFSHINIESNSDPAITVIQEDDK